MDLMRTLPLLALLALAACTPETYIDPIEPAGAPAPAAAAWDLSALTSVESAESTGPALALEVPHLWTGCHGEGRMTFHGDATMTWEIDEQTFSTPFLLDATGNLYPGCGEGCEEMLPYSYDAGLRQWRQFDGYCWYALTPTD